jgi:hypothetical protein
MSYDIIYSSSPEGLVKKVNEKINEGWKPVGQHQVVEYHHQNRYSGTQLMDTIIKLEYSQTIIKD